LSVQVTGILSVKGNGVATIARTATVADAAEALRVNRCGALVVSSDGERVEGIVSERDIVRQLAAKGANVLMSTVADVMTSEVATCGPATQVEELMTLMTERRIRHVPVVADGALAGIVSIGDVVKYRVSQLEDENRTLYSYVTGTH
jgi:CBS domain-containing protein